MKAGDKIITIDGLKLIAVTAIGFTPCAGCIFNDGQGKPCTIPERSENAVCWDEDKNENGDLIFIVDEE